MGAPSLSPSLFRHSHLLSKTLSLTLPRRMARLSFTTAAIAMSSSSESKSKRKLRRESPEGIFRHQLDMCSKNSDLPEALRLYDDALSHSIPISLHHYNSLLYLCTSNLPSGLHRGFDIFHQMSSRGVVPNEATFTSVARLAAAKPDPDLAFQLVKQMKDAGISPKLRSFGPALFGFCSRGDAERAYAVEAHMDECGVAPEDAELAALIDVSSRAGSGDQVYRLMQRLRALVRQVSEETAVVAERWFESETARKVGVKKWNKKKVKEAVVKGGGGWHGQGWLGTGRWNVGRTEMDEGGVCKRCGERLVCVDIDPSETDNFASSLSKLACQKEAMVHFLQFEKWLKQHGPYDAVIDGANVGLYKQNEFSFKQLDTVVKGIRKMSPSKRMPLIILHSRRLKSDLADNPKNKKLIEYWKETGALYATPYGSNDDWYWLYAAVSCKSLLVTNDEMRDHLFQLLGDSFFSRWKEKHQVRLTFSWRGPTFHLPPPYSIVIQESMTGNWHIPIVGGDDIETPRQWVCAYRTAAHSSSSSQVHVASHTSVDHSIALTT